VGGENENPRETRPRIDEAALWDFFGGIGGSTLAAFQFCLATSFRTRRIISTIQPTAIKMNATKKVIPTIRGKTPDRATLTVSSRSASPTMVRSAIAVNSATFSMN